MGVELLHSSYRRNRGGNPLWGCAKGLEERKREFGGDILIIDGIEGFRGSRVRLIGDYLKGSGWSRD